MSHSFYLIAHSHGVSLLDGVTNWRDRLRVRSNRDQRYGDSFQVWFDQAIGTEPFEADVVISSLPLKKLGAWVISRGSGIGRLVGVRGKEAAQCEGTSFRINKKYSEVLASWKGSTPIVSMLAGNQHSRMMINSLPAYDFLDPEVPGIEKGVPIVDARFVDEIVARWTNPVYTALLVASQVTENPLVHVLPPPPRENPQASTHLEAMRELVYQHGFVPDNLRVKWYRRYCRQLAVRLAGIRCKLVHPPAEACSPAGLLKEEYADGLTHGNARYGMLVARQLASLMAQGSR